MLWFSNHPWPFPNHYLSGVETLARVVVEVHSVVERANSDSTISRVLEYSSYYSSKFLRAKYYSTRVQCRKTVLAISELATSSKASAS
jgi:hypothetical protein